MMARGANTSKLPIWPVMAISVLAGVVFLLASAIAHGEVSGRFAVAALDTLRDLGIGLIVAGAVGLVFESLAHTHVVGQALSRVSADLSEAETKQRALLDALEARVHRVGDEIVMSSGMLRNATAVGIEAVYNGREEQWHQDLARAISDAKGVVRIAGISLADVCGFWGGRSAIHEAMDRRMASRDSDTFQILFADPKGPGIRVRAMYEHPGMACEETRAYKQTVAKIEETREITKTARAAGKVEVRLYSAPPVCFLVITEDRLFVEHYHYAGRGGENAVFAIKGKTALFRLYEGHFEALWRDARPLDGAAH